jgi:hypothetical protein
MSKELKRINDTGVEAVDFLSMGSDVAVMDTTDMLSFDTGYVPINTATTQVTVTHNLNTPLSELVVKLFWGSPVTMYDVSLSVNSSTTMNLGTTVYASGNNSFVIRFGANGIFALGADGTSSSIPRASLPQYRVRIYKPQVAAPIFVEGYADNYSETEIQIGWYTRSDLQRKPIYKKVIRGDWGNVAANLNSNVILISTAEDMLDSGGWWMPSTTVKANIGDVVLGGGYATDYPMSDVGLTSPGAIVLTTRSTVARTAGTNSYLFWAVYTKTTDAWA